MRMVLAAALFAAAELICSAALGSPQVSLKPAEVSSAADTRYPVGSIADGVVVLDVALTQRGQISGIDAVRDVASLTSAATSSVESWKFKPASQDGLVQASAMTVAFVFRPPVNMWKPPSFAPAISSPGSITPAYTPAGIVSVGYAEHPVNSVAAGAVVVEVTVDDNGKVERMKVIRSMRGFTQSALRAAKQWQFQPATVKDKPVVSNVAIAFVFATPNSISR